MSNQHQSPKADPANAADTFSTADRLVFLALVGSGKNYSRIRVNDRQLIYDFNVTDDNKDIINRIREGRVGDVLVSLAGIITAESTWQRNLREYRY